MCSRVLFPADVVCVSCVSCLDRSVSRRVRAKSWTCPKDVRARRTPTSSGEKIARKKARLAPGFEFGGRRECRQSTLRKILTAALGGPGAGAFAGSCDPGARTVGRRHAAGAGGALAAARDRHGDGAGIADLA